MRAIDAVVTLWRWLVLFSMLALFNPAWATDANPVASPPDASAAQPVAGVDRQLTAADYANAGDLLRDQQGMYYGDKFRERIAELNQALPTLPDQLQTFGMWLSEEQGWAGMVEPAMVGGLALCLGWLAVLSIGARRAQRRASAAEHAHAGIGSKLYFQGVSLLSDLIGLAAGSLVATGVVVIWFDRSSPQEALLLYLAYSVAMVLGWRAVFRAVLSPQFGALRLIRMPDKVAGIAFRDVTFFLIISYFGFGTFGFLKALGLTPILVSAGDSALALLTNAWIIYRMWSLRAGINNLFSERADGEGAGEAARSTWVRLWPVLISVWLLCLWATWSYCTIIGEHEVAGRVTLAWWLTLSFPLLDRLANGLFKALAAALHFSAWRSERFVRVLQVAFRLTLATVSLVAIARSWNVSAASMITDSDAGAVFVKSLVNMGILSLFAYVAWEYVQAYVERRIPEDERDIAAQLEGEGGGAGASRAETLLPLLRTVMSVILFIIFGLSALRILGVEITPLLAGAGVVGIAIGFGAQKLVQDIISGIFFLVDDAFRRGEYIEIEELRGTVEKISIRSMQLRHHLGAVQTIPYGEIKTVTNLSRDWVTMKLELRLPYDTDIEKVRKIIKKEGQKLLEHPEVGQHFILPLKSQGVLRVEESALIVRMKFTARPGEQWIIRRLAYQRVRDALADAGIRFAHREVRVRLPEEIEQAVSAEQSAQGPQHQLLRAAAAAAGTAIIADEMARKHDDVDDVGDDR